MARPSIVRSFALNPKPDPNPKCNNAATITQRYPARQGFDAAPVCVRDRRSRAGEANCDWKRRACADAGGGACGSVAAEGQAYVARAVEDLGQALGDVP